MRNLWPLRASVCLSSREGGNNTVDLPEPGVPRQIKDTVQLGESPWHGDPGSEDKG